MSILVYDEWDQIEETTQRKIVSEKKVLHWDFKEWFANKWTLRIGTIDGDLVVVSWTRSINNVGDYYFPITSKCRLIWQTTVMPAYRGLGIYPVMLQCLCEHYINEGVENIYIHSLDYNHSSNVGIQKAGFRLIGIGVRTRIKGRTIWYPICCGSKSQ